MNSNRIRIAKRDTSGSNQWIRWMTEEITEKSLLRKYRETVGHERIVFESD